MTNPKVELKLKLLKTVGRYYPIGLPLSTNSYDGYKELKRIVDQKVTTLIESGSIEPWDSLFERLKEHFPSTKIQNWSFRNYPSISASIELSHVSDERISRISSIEIFISLLGPYFTVVFTEQFIDIVENKIPRSFVWALAPTSKVQINQLNSIKGVVQKSYPEYEFIDDNLLFETVVMGSIPHGVDIETAFVENPGFKYKLFDYLFEPNSSIVGY